MGTMQNKLRDLIDETSQPYDQACLQLDDLCKKISEVAPQCLAEAKHIQSLLLKSAYPFDELVTQILKESTMSSIRESAVAKTQEENIIPSRSVTITIKGNRATIKNFLRDTYNVFGARYGIRPPYTGASEKAIALSQALQNPEWTLLGAILTIDEKNAEMLPRAFIKVARKRGLEVNFDSPPTADIYKKPTEGLNVKSDSTFLEHVRARSFHRTNPIRKTGEIRPTI